MILRRCVAKEEWPPNVVQNTIDQKRGHLKEDKKNR